MLNNELELVYESVEESRDYESVVQAIEPEWIEKSLLATGKASIRNRRLPAQQAIWLVIWMGLIRNKSIKEVCSSMDIALQPSTNNEWS
ncbi:Insertion element 4 transposase N-terminal, partial [Colwellia chukchiensis]